MTTVQSLWTWLNTPPALVDVLDPFVFVFAVVFTVGFITSAYLAGPGGQQRARNERQAHDIHHWSVVGLWLFAPGLFFLAVRLLQINPLSFAEPIWLLGSLIALLVAALRFAAWRRKEYPSRSEPISFPAHQTRPPRPPRWEREAGG